MKFAAHMKDPKKLQVKDEGKSLEYRPSFVFFLGRWKTVLNEYETDNEEQLAPVESRKITSDRHSGISGKGNLTSPFYKRGYNHSHKQIFVMFTPLFSPDPGQYAVLSTAMLAAV